MKIETMTIYDCVQEMRRMGMRTCQAAVADGIETGLFPFGTMVKKNRCRRKFQIYRVDFDRWAKSVMTESTT